MNVSTSTGAICNKIGLRNAIQVLKDAGFDCFDLSLCSPIPEIQDLFTADNFQELAKTIRSWADEIGIPCNQTHAPFPTSRGDESDEEIFQALVRSIEISAIMGAKVTVVHPKQHLYYADHQRDLFPMNVEFYKRLMPYAEKFGVKVATENMWQANNGSQIPSDSVCSRAWEFNELIDAVDNPYLVGCLDIGHVSLMGADIPKFIHDMGAKRIQALHIHDTDFVDDSHTLPFIKKIDYLSVAKALGEIGYSGDFTFESGSFFRPFPQELMLPAAALMCQTGKFLAGKIEEAKA